MRETMVGDAEQNSTVHWWVDYLDHGPTAGTMIAIIQSLDGRQRARFVLAPGTTVELDKTACGACYCTGPTNRPCGEGSPYLDIPGRGRVLLTRAQARLISCEVPRAAPGEQVVVVPLGAGSQ